MTNHAARGDTAVTRTVQEPSRPSSSPPLPARAPASADATGGGRAGDPVADALDVLPEPVRGHPSVVPSTLTRRLRTLDQRGWPRVEIRKRLAGIETAEAPGAAALTRLGDLARLTHPPCGPSVRPGAGPVTHGPACARTLTATTNRIPAPNVIHEPPSLRLRSVQQRRAAQTAVGRSTNDPVTSGVVIVITLFSGWMCVQLLGGEEPCVEVIDGDDPTAG